MLPEVESEDFGLDEDVDSAGLELDVEGLPLSAGELPLTAGAADEEEEVDGGGEPAAAADACAFGDPAAQPPFLHTSSQLTLLYNEGSL